KPSRRRAPSGRGGTLQGTRQGRERQVSPRFRFRRVRGRQGRSRSHPQARRHPLRRTKDLCRTRK
ncbi:hypothetical protein HKX48_002374, partial [Thoreauomyces humboldtii]